MATGSRRPPTPEEFFAAHHRQFIETVMKGKSHPALPRPRPYSPWQGRARAATTWATAEDVDHYAAAFADPMSHAHAISYYRYGLPFHVVTPDPAATHGESFESLGERAVAAMGPPRRPRSPPPPQALHGLRPRRPP